MAATIDQTHTGFGDNIAGDKIINIAPDPTAITKKYLTVIPPLPETFIGREDETIAITDQLQKGDNPLIIRGMGGLGKSTIAKVVLDKLAAAAKHVAWIDASQGLKQGFTNGNLLQQLKIAIEESSASPEEQLNEVFRSSISVLLNLEGKSVMVIDNLLQEEDLASLRTIKTLQKNWLVLITSRHHFEGFKEFNLGFLDPAKCMELFYTYYTHDKNDTVLQQVLSDIGYHTLTTEMMSKTGQKLRLNITEIASRISKKGLNIASKSNIAVDHSTQSVDNILDYMLRIFALGDMSTMEDIVLKNFAVINSYNFGVGAMFIFMYQEQENDADLKDEFNLAISSLIDKGWFIILEEEKKEAAQKQDDEEEDEIFIKMHPLIQEMVRLQLKPVYLDCKNIVSFFTRMSLNHLTAAVMPKFMLVKIALATNLNDPLMEIFALKTSLVADYIEMGFKNDAIALLDSTVALMETAEQQGVEIDDDTITALATFYSQAGNDELAMQYIKSVIDSLTDPNSDKAADLHHNAAEFLLNLQQYDTAEAYANKALNIRKANYPEGDISWAQEYRLLGKIAQTKEKIISSDTATKYIESYNITKKFADKESFTYAMAEIEMAILLAGDDSFKEQVNELLKTGIEIFHKIYNGNAEALFYVETAAARTCERIDELQNAHDYYQSAISRMENEQKTSSINFIESMVSYARFAKYRLQDNPLATSIITKACQYQEYFIDNTEFTFLREARDEILAP
ncbi:NB-ARC domain-containing protein [Ferruginibacter sp.]